MKKYEKILLVAAIIVGVILIIQNAFNNKDEKHTDTEEISTEEIQEEVFQEEKNYSDNPEKNIPTATYLTLSSEDLAFGRTGGTESLTVNTDATDWSVENVPSWLSISRSGNSFNVSCESNHSGSKREYQIVVKAGNMSSVVFVSQTATPAQLSLSCTKVSLDRPGGDFTIDVNTDADDWNALSYVPGSSLTKDGNKLHVKVPYLNAPSSGWQIVVQVEFGGATVLRKTVTVQQKGYCASCNGTGRHACSWCSGMGTEMNYTTDIPMMMPCSRCNGQKYFRCSSCDGTGNSKY